MNEILIAFESYNDGYMADTERFGFNNFWFDEHNKINRPSVILSDCLACMGECSVVVSSRIHDWLVGNGIEYSLKANSFDDGSWEIFVIIEKDIDAVAFRMFL